MRYQDLLLQWIAREPGSLGLLLLALGGIYGFIGFRFYRPLLGLSAGFFGWVGGSLLAGLSDNPPGLGGLAGLGLGVGLGALAPKAAAVTVTGLVWGLLGAYLTEQFGLGPMWVLGLGATGLAFGATFELVASRANVVVLTTLQGVVLLLVGIVGFSSEFFPVFGNTFRSWAASWALLVPVILVMFTVTSVAFQENHRQGHLGVTA
jgi:hypothetical protein